jgi:hypothetical protein
MSRLALALLVLAAAGPAAAHGVAGGDAAFMQGSAGFDPGPWLYLGAKHMVTGYDHLLFLAGVVFLLHRLRDVTLYVTLFSLGHSLTLLLGVLGGIAVSPYLVDAVIGLSVVWKALDNLGAFRSWPGYDPRLAVLGFGLVHGLGLSTKLQDFGLAGDGLVGNILAFNLGVELGQVVALTLILAALALWRATPAFARAGVAANVALMALGFALFQAQMLGFLAQGSA